MGENIRDTFLNELGAFYATGVMPHKVSINMRHALNEHRQRLMSRGITYSEQFLPNGDTRASSSAWGNGKFKMTNSSKHCNAVTSMTNGVTGIKCDEAKDDVVHCHVIDINESASSNDEDMMMECPNCGHAAMAKVFVDGCPSCGTRFQMSDFYPCVNTYYSMPWPLPKTNWVEVAVRRAIKIGIIVGIIVGIITAFVMFFGGSNPILTLIVPIAVALLVGWATFLISYLIGQGVATVQTVGGLAKVAVNTLDMAGARDSRRKAEEAIRPYDPDFSFDVFEGKIISSIRTIAFSNNRANCCLYEGADPLVFMNDLVDIRYRGACKFENATLIGDYLHVVMTAFLDNVFYVNGQFGRVKENFTVELVRQKDVRTPVQFSAYSANCPSCGGTFDAVLSKQCPYCGHRYDHTIHDWTVIRLVKS